MAIKRDKKEEEDGNSFIFIPITLYFRFYRPILIYLLSFIFLFL